MYMNHNITDKQIEIFNTLEKKGYYVLKYKIWGITVIQ